MMQDREENVVTLSEKPNAHLLILGCSGSGKTYFICRKLEEELKKGKKIFILDYSGSYTLSELNKARFRNTNMVRIFKPLELDMNWFFGGEDLQSELVFALLKVLRTESYYQKKLLREAMKEVFTYKRYFSIPLLVKQLEEFLIIKEDADERKNIFHLLSRLEPYSEINEIQFSESKETVWEDSKVGIEIIQLSDYSHLRRKFLVEFLTEIFWSETRSGYRRADIVLFDEFQNVDIKPGSGLSAMLREGRKFGLAVYMSSQFLGNYDKEAVDTLMQAGNMIFFRPTVNDRKSIAGVIDLEQNRIWQSILDKLQVGEAVIKGKYYLNGNTKEISEPIICKVQEVEKDG